MKVTIKDITSSFDNLNESERAFMQKNAEFICDAVNKAAEGMLSTSEVEERFKSINEKLTASVTENESLRKQNEDLAKVVRGLSEEIEKAKNRGADLISNNKFLDRFDEMMNSKKLKDFQDGIEKASGWFDGFSVKEIANIANIENGYTGNSLLAFQSNVVTSPFAAPKMSVRDAIRTIPSDPTQPQFTYLRVKDFDRNAQYVTENGRLAKSNLTFEEVQCNVRRVGSYFDISKNLLLARIQLRSFLVQQIPGIIRQAENAAVLFGDGTKSQLLGITRINGVGSVEEQITATIVTGQAGDVAKVESYNNGKSILVEFAKPISKALSAMQITFAGASVNTSLNTNHPIIKLNDRQVIVEGAEYVGNETAVASMTFTINHASFKSVEAPNSRDVVSAIYACLSFAQYTPNAIFLNPLTIYRMKTEKDTLGRSLDIVENVNGVLSVAGLPVVEAPDVPEGMYVAGDFLNGANLYDYSALEMQFVEDAETVLYNMVRLVFQEQLGLVVYMPWAFAYGSLDALKTAITKG